MPSVLLVDTSVFLNVLDIPGFNQDRNEVLVTLERYINVGDISLLLPLCAIIETGNHIAHLSDGRQRRRYAELFIDQVRAAILGDAPWQATQTLDLSKMEVWLPDFPDHAMQEIGLADMAIIQEFHEACNLYPRHEVAIWTLDRHMRGYQRRARAR